MPAKGPLELIADLKSRVGNLPAGDEKGLDAWRRSTEMVIRNLFGTDSKYLQDLKALSFYPAVYPAEQEWVRGAWEEGRYGAANLLETMSDELRLFGTVHTDTTAMPAVALATTPARNVFVVHGHDDAMKEAVARTLVRIDLTPIILHEKPNRGRTIIEKFTDYSNVQFAVVLLSPDDVGRALTQSAEHTRPRARQNVVFELGFFLGRLGRDRVIALYRDEKNFEMSSDYSGVLFTAFDVMGRWQFDLIRELKAAGYKVDANRLIE